jgi:hypothetical protein
MSFSWSASSSPSFVGIKPAPTNSFADALKRLAEHVEEKNRNSKSIHHKYIFFHYYFHFHFLVDANNGETSGLVRSPTDLPNRIISSHVNNSISPEQALRLYTQYIHEVFTFDS